MTTIKTFEGSLSDDIKRDIDYFCHNFNYEVVNVSITYNSDWKQYDAIAVFKNKKGGAE
jgi:hypothetical protein